jgi:hypothetical protein
MRNLSINLLLLVVPATLVSLKKPFMSSIVQEVNLWAQQPRVKRVLMHVGFWIFWLFRTFYDIVSLYGLGPGELLFMLVYTATQVPMMYFHLYFLVPRLLNNRRYVLYAACTIALVFAYSYVNYTLLTLLTCFNFFQGLEFYRQPECDMIFEGCLRW